jgi:hypothetical protein
MSPGQPFLTAEWRHVARARFDVDEEHKWGFGRSPRGELRFYRVLHPPWEIHPAATAKLDVESCRELKKTQRRLSAALRGATTMHCFIAAMHLPSHSWPKCS